MHVLVKGEVFLNGPFFMIHYIESISVLLNKWFHPPLVRFPKLYNFSGFFAFYKFKKYSIYND